MVGMPQVLVKTDVTKYLEFKAVDGSFVLNKEKVEKVPATSFEALKSPLMGFFEKRRAAKFFRYCMPTRWCSSNRLASGGRPRSFAIPALLRIRRRRPGAGSSGAAGCAVHPSCIFGSNLRSFTAAYFATALMHLRVRSYWQDYDAANPATHAGRDLACICHI